MMDFDDLIGDEIDKAGNEDRDSEFERDIWLSGGED
jgi:hypothetical protein